MAKKGDIVEVRSERSGERTRKGLVLSAMGHILKIAWDDETESMFIPGPGTLTVLGREHDKKRLAARELRRK